MVPAGTNVDAEVRSGRPKVPVKVRRNLATCLLLTIHPLLGLTPTDGLVDLQEDHPGSGMIQIQNLQIQIQECQTGSLVFGVGVNSNSGLIGSISGWTGWAKWMAGQGKQVCSMQDAWAELWQRVLAQVKKDLEQSGFCWDSAPVDLKAEECCPWMKQQARKCQPATVAAPEVTRDVLTNLQNLVDAEDLFKVAEKLRQRGQMSEAFDCYEIIGQLCPGSRVEEMATQARNQMFTVLYTGAELLPMPKESVPDPSDWKTRIKSQLQTPVTLSYNERPIFEIVEDIRTNQGINIVEDWPAIEDSNLDLETPVTIKVQNISLRSALKLVLHQGGLNYVLKHEVVLIVPEKKAEAPTPESVPETAQPTTSQSTFDLQKFMFVWYGAGPPRKVEPGVCEQVRGLMKACRLAVETGRYKKAMALAHEAYALDPEGVTADPLVYKMHLVSCKTPRQVSIANCIGGGVGCLVSGSCCGSLVGSALGGMAGACVSGDKCCCGSEKGCGGKCEGECKCTTSSGCPFKAAIKGRNQCLRQSVKAVADFCKWMSECSAKDASKEQVYPCCYPETEKDGECPCHKKKGKCGSCPVNNCPASPCTPPRKEDEQEPEARRKPSLQPDLPPVDAGLVRYLEKLVGEGEEQETKELEVVTEDQSRGPVEMKLGFDLSPASLLFFNTTCADVKVTPGQVELSWQVKVGPCVWQVRYGKAGCWFDAQPTETDTDDE